MAAKSEPKMNRESPSGRNLPLAGIVVVDLGQVYQGPYAAFLMAKAGADVIKVEPVHGEPSRTRAKVGRGASLSMAMLNTNKRGVTLNLKSERGCELLRAMVERADVLVENFAPGVMDGLGVGWSVLHEVNPRLIYASATGFGLSGPDHANLAMDLTIQAYAGMMSITGFPDGPPVRSGATVADFLGGIHLYGGIVTALYERTISGEGRLVEVAMEEAVYHTLTSNLGMLYNTGGAIPPRVGNRHGGLALAPYNVYPTNDGHVAILCLTEGHWKNLLVAMGRTDLETDPRFTTNRKRVEFLADTDAVVQGWTEQHSRQELFELTRRHRIPSAPVRDLREVMNDPHMHARGMLEWVDDPDLGRVVLPSTPIRLHGTERVKTVSSPLLGQHNHEVYESWLGLSHDEVDGLRRDGII